MNTKEIKARRLTVEEVEKLDTNTEFFITGQMTGLPDVDHYAPAHLTRPGSEFEGGSFEFRTVFGEKLYLVPSAEEDDFGVCVADKNGDSVISVIQSAGLFVNLAVFVPEQTLDGLDKFVLAIQDAFGAGNAKVWNVAALRDAASLVPDAQYDVFEVQSGRGRKPSEGPKQHRLASGVYAQRAQFFEPQPGFKLEVRHHTPVVDETPTI